MMAVGTAYRIEEPVRGDIPSPVHGWIEFSFDPGIVEPRSEQDEFVLAHLVANHIAGCAVVPPTADAPASPVAPVAQVGDEVLAETPIPPESPAPSPGA